MKLRRMVLALTVAMAVGGSGPAAWAKPPVSFEKAAGLAERAFQAGDVETGLTLLRPFTDTVGPRTGDLRRIFDSRPEAATAFAQRIERDAARFRNKKEALAVAHRLGNAFVGALITPDAHVAIASTLEARAADQNLKGTVPWLLTDRYADVPGLAEPEQERIIFMRTLDHAMRAPSAAATGSLLSYVARHPEDAESAARLRSQLPMLPVSGAANLALARRIFPDVPLPVPSESAPVQPSETLETENRRLRERLEEDWERERRRDEEWRWRQDRLDAERRALDEDRRLAEETRSEEETHRRDDERRRQAEFIDRVNKQRWAEERRRAEEERRRGEERRKHAEELRQAQERREHAEEHRRAEEQRQADERRQAQERQRQAREQHRIAEELRQEREERRKADERRQAQERQSKADDQRRADERRRVEEERQREEEKRKRVEEQRRATDAQSRAEERRRMEEQRRLEEKRHREDEARRRDEEKRRMEERRRAEEQRRAVR